ncbi:MAG: hypothetical protein A2Y17_11125 [Clostridiales bacterium GWF2_38_85]|nr:MAG: hypothetical protein A2Y17_11125 [Clostridiales bacterium GWF2_38_85]HBL84677.1 hypothetical protein [Clostridiales bacterium]
MYSHEVIKSAMEYIVENYNEDLNCNFIAEKFAYSEYYFHRLFKHITNISVTDYIRDMRLFFAANKLLDSKDTILDICLSCGFENQRTFDRAFKENTDWHLKISAFGMNMLMNLSRIKLSETIIID